MDWHHAALRSDTEDLMHESNLAGDVALFQPSYLPFSDHVHRFVSRNRVECPADRSEPKARNDPLLDEAVILFDDVV